MTTQRPLLAAIFCLVPLRTLAQQPKAIEGLKGLAVDLPVADASPVQTPQGVPVPVAPARPPSTEWTEAARLALSRDVSNDAFRPHPDVIAELQAALARMRAVVPALTDVREEKPVDTEIFVSLDREVLTKLEASGASGTLRGGALAAAGAPEFEAVVAALGAKARLNPSGGVYVQLGGPDDPRDLPSFAAELSKLPGVRYADPERNRYHDNELPQPNLTHGFPIVVESLDGWLAVFVKPLCRGTVHRVCEEADWWFLRDNGTQARLEGHYQRRLGPNGVPFFTGTVPWTLRPPRLRVHP